MERGCGVRFLGAMLYTPRNVLVIREAPIELWYDSGLREEAASYDYTKLCSCQWACRIELFIRVCCRAQY